MRNRVVTRRATAAGDLYQAIADPTRRSLLDRLRGGSVAAGELAAGFRISRPAISRHLAVLRRAGLVREERQGRNRLYQLTPASLREVADWATRYRDFWQHNLEASKRHLEEER